MRIQWDYLPVFAGCGTVRVMNRKELFTAGIFFISFLSLLLVSFNALLSPLRKDISRVETEIKALDVKLDRLIFAILADQAIIKKPVKNPKSKQVTKDKQAKIQ